MVSWPYRDERAVVRQAINDAIGSFGKKWFVDAKVGSNSHAGDVPDAPLATMAAAFTRIRSGDTIVFRGKVREQVTAPDGVFDVTIIGGGNQPRHSDDHTESDGKRGSSAATWALPLSPAGATPLVTLNNQGWRFMNFLMQADTSQVCIDLVTNSEAGDAEYSAGHFSCYNMRFAGPGIGIRDNGPTGFVNCHDSFFTGLTTGITFVAGAGPGTRSWWSITGNRFSDNTNAIVLGDLRRSLIKRNDFLPTHTLELTLTGGSSNIVTENVFTGDYDLAVAGTGDCWFNNYALDTASAEVSDTSGQTTSVPVA